MLFTSFDDDKNVTNIRLIRLENISFKPYVSEKEMALEKLEVSIIQHQMNLKKSKSDMNKIISEKEAECDQIRLSTQKSVNEIQMKLECEIRSRSEAVKEKKSQGCNFEEIVEAIFISSQNPRQPHFYILEKDKKFQFQTLKLSY